ncbi:MAG: 4'-phosphopantetheinyl transferase superfamily protein [Chloroflexi bacterium]|nr:4'-phosphopantetheinyl transferase superfamily protein [Chloroflexota bacterium]
MTDRHYRQSFVTHEMRDTWIDVWTAELDRTPAELRGLAGLLSRDERERAERFVFQGDRDRFIAAHGFVRSVLGATLGVDPGAIVFGTEPQGKPFLIGTSGLHFNLSHSAGFALCAVAWERALGVDVEAESPSGGLEGVIDRVCSRAERESLCQLDPAERRRAVLQLWTRKEAYVKMRGEGLRFDVRRIEVELGASSRSIRTWVDGRESTGQWELCDLLAPAGYVAALAAEGKGWQARLAPWHFKAGS